MWRVAVVQPVMYDAEIERAFLVRETLGVLKAPLLRRELVADEPFVEIRDRHIRKAARGENVPIEHPAAEDEDPHVTRQLAARQQSLDGLCIEIAHRWHNSAGCEPHGLCGRLAGVSGCAMHAVQVARPRATGAQARKPQMWLHDQTLWSGVSRASGGACLLGGLSHLVSRLTRSRNLCEQVRGGPGGKRG